MVYPKELKPLNHTTKTRRSCELKHSSNRLLETLRSFPTTLSLMLGNKKVLTGKLIRTTKSFCFSTFFTLTVNYFLGKTSLMLANLECDRVCVILIK